LRKVQSHGHRESTKLRGSLAIEAENFSECANKATALYNTLAQMQSALNHQLHTSIENDDYSFNSAHPSPLLLPSSPPPPGSRRFGLQPPGNMSMTKSTFRESLATTLHDFDNRNKPFVHLTSPSALPPPSSAPPPGEIFVPVGPPPSPPPPGTNPLFNRE